MKKRIIGLLLFCMMAFGTLAQASNIDETMLADLSIEELQRIKELVTIEMATRLGDNSDTYISNGVYVAGKDIKAGSYRFVGLNLNGEVYPGLIRLFETEEDYTNWDDSYDDSYIKYDVNYGDGDVLSLTLEEGNVIFIDYYGGSITESKPSWLP